MSISVLQGDINIQHISYVITFPCPHLIYLWRYQIGNCSRLIQSCSRLLKLALFEAIGSQNRHPFPFKRLIHDMVLHRTVITEFMPPNGLATSSLASGSGIHLPSTTKQYSYVPGAKAVSFTQRPPPEGC